MTTDSLQGRTINGYRLLRQMGEGGTALVYRAEHPERGTTAVKVLRHRLAEDPVAVKRFLSESEFGKRVTHPNIVKTYDYGQSDGLYYLALEWIEGEPLANFATRSGPLAPAVVATGAFPNTKTAEPWESVLIRFEGATVTDEDIGFGEWTFDDGSGPAVADDWGNFYDKDGKTVLAWVRTCDSEGKVLHYTV